MIETVRLQVSALTNRVYATTGDMKNNKKNVTADFYKAVIDVFLNNPMILKGKTNGKSYEVEVKEVQNDNSKV